MRKCILLFALLLTGCGSSEPQPSDIRGTATFDGKPIVYGEIEFVPDASKQMKGPAGTAEVIDGEFDTSKSGRGVFLGDYEIRVTAWNARPGAANPDETVTSNIELPIFIGYVVNQAVKADGNVIAVPADAKGFGLQTGKASKKGPRAAPAP